MHLLAASALNGAVSGISSMAQTIADMGILVVIGAVVVIFLYKQMNGMVKRDNKLFAELSPRMAAIETELGKMKQSLDANLNDVDSGLSLQLSNHNAHTNQAMSAIEKDQDDIRRMLLQSQDTLNDISGRLTAINNSILMLSQLASGYTTSKSDE